MAGPQDVEAPGRPDVGKPVKALKGRAAVRPVKAPRGPVAGKPVEAIKGTAAETCGGA